MCEAGREWRAAHSCLVACQLQPVPAPSCVHNSVPSVSQDRVIPVYSCSLHIQDLRLACLILRQTYNSGDVGRSTSHAEPVQVGCDLAVQFMIADERRVRWGPANRFTIGY